MTRPGLSVFRVVQAGRLPCHEEHAEKAGGREEHGEDSAASGYSAGQDYGAAGGTGSAIARELLTKFRLTASPDMGRIILNELNMPLNARRKYSQAELKAMADQLEAALICFRAAETEMDCTPETMLALRG